jgi:hypothetical protein
MLTIERRVAALEASASDGSMKIIIVEDGETQADALKRPGYPSHGPGVVFGLPSDAML